MLSIDRSSNVCRIRAEALAGCLKASLAAGAGDRSQWMPDVPAGCSVASRHFN